jgi:hypothetical protein
MAVRDFLHKASVYETEADAIGVRLKQEIFRSELSLETKIILRDSINFIDKIADKAEDVLDIAIGWVLTPILAAIASFIMPFIVQNVFSQPVYQASFAS